MQYCFAILVMLSFGCRTTETVESVPSSGIILGRALDNGDPASHRTIVARAFNKSCGGAAFGGGSANSDNTGSYFINVVILAPPGSYCVKIGFPSADGRDTSFITRTLSFRTRAPYDSAHADLSR
jgi:hypothetical protein